jgi:uncharacterized RDD family membrane protein YckC
MSDGWHDDPFGRYSKRYHDGSNWTSYVSNGGVTEQDPMGTQASPPGMPMAPPVTDMPPQQHGAAGFAALPGNPILRFVARLIDAVIIGVPVWFVLSAIFDINMDFSDPEAIEFPVTAYLIQFAVFALYDIYMVGAYGRTLGKMVCGLTVVRRNDVTIPGYGVATVRYIVGLLYAIPLIGWILFIITAVLGFTDSLRQTIHDKLASTVVAKTSSLRS